MKKRILRLLLGCLLGIGLLSLSLIALLLSPQLSYARQTNLPHITLYHQAPLSPHFLSQVERSVRGLQATPLWQAQSHFRLCLPDSSGYPSWVETLMGPDVVRSFADISVIQSTFSSDSGSLVWRGSHWPLETMLRHSMTHSLQFQHHGFWKANPLGRHPVWKWEGYAEWIAWGKAVPMDSLRLLYGSHDAKPWEHIQFPSGQGSMRKHVQYLMCPKYLLEEQNLTYSEFMSDTLKMNTIWSFL